MIEIKNIQTPDGRTIDRSLESSERRVIDGKDLMLFPALIDPHVHFRVPGGEYKEDWMTAAAAAIAGGVTTVFDMPNNTPSCISRERLKEKTQLIDEQLKKAKIPLRYYLYLGADQNHLDQIPLVKDRIIGLKIYMGSSTGDLLMDQPEALENAFRIAGEHDVLIAVHAEDEEMIRQRKNQHAGKTDPSLHSVIRSPEVAARAVAQAIELAEKYRVRLYIVHVSTREELKLIRAAKKKGIPVYAEATPHHLFLDTGLYKKIGTFALVNPPLRSPEEREALWEAVHDGTIDTIGTDHAPHTIEEKKRPYGEAPSGFPSIEIYFSLLLNAHSEGKISLNKIVSLTHTRPQEIFRLPRNDDIVLVDLKKKWKVEGAHLKTKAKWSPYDGSVLHGSPRYAILRGKCFEL